MSHAGDTQPVSLCLCVCVFHLSSSSALILLSMLILMKSSLRSHSDPATLTSFSLAFGGSIVAIIHTTGSRRAMEDEKGVRDRKKEEAIGEEEEEKTEEKTQKKKGRKDPPKSCLIFSFFLRITG